MTESPDKLRFIADETLGKLARYLRMSGYDCKYLDSKCVDPILPAVEEDRILLTRNRSLEDESSKWDGLVCFNPRSDCANEQLKELSQRFDLKLSTGGRSRCPRCNLEIIAVEPESVTGVVPDYILSRYSVFYRCPKCLQVFWRGSHIDRFRGTR